MSETDSNSGAKKEAVEYEVIILIPQAYKVYAKSLKEAERKIRYKLTKQKDQFPEPPMLHSITEKKE